MEEDKKKNSFLKRVQKLPEPLRRLILWGVMALLVLLILLVMAERVKQSTSSLEGVRKEEMFGEPERLDEFQKRQEDLEKGWQMLEESKEVIEELEKEKERIIKENQELEE